MYSHTRSVQLNKVGLQMSEKNNWENHIFLIFFIFNCMVVQKQNVPYVIRHHTLIFNVHFVFANTVHKNGWLGIKLQILPEWVSNTAVNACCWSQCYSPHNAVIIDGNLENALLPLYHVFSHGSPLSHCSELRFKPRWLHFLCTDTTVKSKKCAIVYLTWLRRERAVRANNNKRTRELWWTHSSCS